jgi:hypothetical protein
MFRMNITTLLSMCNDLEMQYELKPSRKISVIENIEMFLYTITLGALNKEVHKRFYAFK